MSAAIVARISHIWVVCSNTCAKCRYCEKKISFHNSLHRHKCTNSNERKFSCDKGEYTTTTLAYLKSHLPRHSSNKPHCCGIWTRSFANKRGLIQHKGFLDENSRAIHILPSHLILTSLHPKQGVGEHPTRGIPQWAMRPRQAKSTFQCTNGVKGGLIFFNRKGKIFKKGEVEFERGVSSSWQ